jgi:hypothetical protein
LQAHVKIKHQYIFNLQKVNIILKKLLTDLFF